MPFQFFGTSGAIPSRTRDNTALAFYSARETVLIDCSGSPYQRIVKAGLDPDSVAALIVTHRHVDHLYGLPSLAHNLGLAGRRKTLHVHANAETMPTLKGFFGLFPLEAKMPYGIEFHDVPPAEGHILLEADGFRVCSTPVRHGAPNIAVRVDWTGPDERGAVVYSSDTSPCPSLLALARGADILIHEATFLDSERARAAADGHTTASQAGEVARQAGAKRLLLCHMAAPLHNQLAAVQREAEQSFGNPVEIAEEFREYRV